MEKTSLLSKPATLFVVGVGFTLLIFGIVFYSGYVKDKANSQDFTQMQSVNKQELPLVTETLNNTENPNKEINSIEVEAGSFYYKPDEIRVKKGQPVRLILKSVDMMHDFNVDELGIKVPITKAGEISTVEFTPQQVGIFEYYCSVGNHRANGQVGKIIVE